MCAEMCQPTTWQVCTGPPELAQVVWQGCPLALGIKALQWVHTGSHQDHSARWRLHNC